MPHMRFRNLSAYGGLVARGHPGQKPVHGGPRDSRFQALTIGDAAIANAFYRRTLDMEIARFGNEGTSDLMNRFTGDMEGLASALNEVFGKLVREPLKMIVCLLGAAWVCWRLLLVSLLLAPLAAYMIRWLAKALKRANRIAMEEMSTMYNTLDETFQGIKVVKAFTMERLERRRLLINSRKYFFKQMRIARYDALTRPLIEMIGVLTICLALLVGPT